MTEAVQVALIVAVPSFVAALGGLIVSIRTAFKTEQIHTATNGTLHEMKAHDRVQNEKMAGLEKQIAALLEDKRVAAEIAKTSVVDAKAADLLATKTTPAIEENTRAVKDNTASTDLNSEIRSGIQPKKFG